MVDYLILLSLAFIFYTYLGYPLFLFLLSLFKTKKVLKDYEVQPLVSFVIAARNEEKNILQRMNNILDQDYPHQKIQLLIVSDCSTDKTANLVLDWISEHGKRLLDAQLIELPEASGKPTALSRGVEQASGEILVFGDCRQKFESNAVKELVANFGDEQVGGVSGELKFYKDSSSEIEQEMGAYWRYEKLIRKLESKTGSVVGVTGAIYAVRKKLFQTLPPETILDDVLVPLRVVKQKYRILFDPQAVAYDYVSLDSGQEWNRKVRTLAGNWQLFFLAPEICCTVFSGIWSRLWFHKFFRLFVPLFLLILLLTSFLSTNILAGILFYAQLFFYFLAFLAYNSKRLKKYKVISLICFFCMLNVAVVFGLFRCFNSRKSSLWK